MAAKFFTIWIELVPTWDRDGFLTDIRLGKTWTAFPDPRSLVSSQMPQPFSRIMEVNITVEETAVNPFQVSTVATQEMLARAYVEAKDVFDG